MLKLESIIQIHDTNAGILQDTVGGLHSVTFLCYFLLHFKSKETAHLTKSVQATGAWYIRCCRHIWADFTSCMVYPCHALRRMLYGSLLRSQQQTNHIKLHPNNCTALMHLLPLNVILSPYSCKCFYPSTPVTNHLQCFSHRNILVSYPLQISPSKQFFAPPFEDLSLSFSHSYSFPFPLEEILFLKFNFFIIRKFFIQDVIRNIDASSA